MLPRAGIAVSGRKPKLYAPGRVADWQIW
jgi:hypothetical protein